MNILGHKEIEVYEYDSTSITTPKIKANLLNQHSNLNLTFRRMSLALAKSILTSNPTSFQLMSEILISSMQLLKTISARGVDLRLKDNFRNSIRDFSKTTKTGELAQAVSILFAQEILNYPLVFDFDGYLNLNGFSYPWKTKKPDFAILMQNSKTFSFLESKGTCPAKQTISYKPDLRKALGQCTNAYVNLKRRYATLNISNIYGTLVEISEYGDKWFSSLRFADPSLSDNHDNSNPNLNFLIFIKCYYAAWFTLCGFQNLASRLLNNEKIDFPKPFEYLEVNQKKYLVFNDFIRYSRSYYLFEYPYFINGERFGLDEEVFNLLNSDNPDDALNTFNKIAFVSTSNKDYELFKDGTIFFYHTPNNSF